MTTVASDQAKWLDKVTALLDKAESTEFPEEAEAFSAAAEKLMAKYAIDQMMIDFKKGKREQVEEPVIVPYVCKAPYAQDKVFMIFKLAHAMGCKMYYIPTRRDGYKTRNNIRNHDLDVRLVGFQSDIDLLVQLYESLVIQEAIARKFAIKDQFVEGHYFGSKKVFSASFIRGFAQTSSQRVKATYKRVEEESGSTAALAVVSRQKRVSDLYGKQGVNTGKRSNRQNDYAGNLAGRAAGEQATIQKAVK